PIGVPVAIDDAIVQCGRCAKDWGGPDERVPHCATTKHACVPLDDYSAKAFNRLVRCRRVLDAFIAVRAGRRVNAAAALKLRQLKARVARERARFLRCLDAAEHDPNSRVGDDADKVKRSPLAVAAFREEVRKRAALKHLAQRPRGDRHALRWLPACVTTMRDGEDGNSSDSSASDIDEYRWDSEDDLLDAADASAHRRDPSESSSDSEGDDAPALMVPLAALMVLLAPSLLPPLVVKLPMVKGGAA
ncbi:unnamed protein product, partial [Aureobasidium pullulans]